MSGEPFPILPDGSIESARELAGLKRRFADDSIPPHRVRLLGSARSLFVPTEDGDQCHFCHNPASRAFRRIFWCDPCVDRVVALVTSGPIFAEGEKRPTTWHHWAHCFPWGKLAVRLMWPGLDWRAMEPPTLLRRRAVICLACNEQCGVRRGVHTGESQGASERERSFRCCDSAVRCSLAASLALRNWAARAVGVKWQMTKSITVSPQLCFERIRICDRLPSCCF